MNALPSFKSSFLENIIFDIKKRSKAIKNKVTSYKVERVLDKSENNTYEKMELEFKLQMNQVSLRFYFWDDRITWIDIRQSSKNGWIFEWTAEGRIGGADPKDIILKIEQSIEIAKSLSEGISHHALNILWGSILSSGPKAV